MPLSAAVEIDIPGMDSDFVIIFVLGIMVVLAGCIVVMLPSNFAFAL